MMSFQAWTFGNQRQVTNNLWRTIATMRRIEEARWIRSPASASLAKKPAPRSTQIFGGMKLIRVKGAKITQSPSQSMELSSALSSSPPLLLLSRFVELVPTVLLSKEWAGPAWNRHCGIQLFSHFAQNLVGPCIIHFG